MSTKSKGSFVVMLEGEKKAPKLIINVKPSSKKNMFDVAIIHPNTRQVIVEKVLQCKDFNEAFEKANELKSSDEVLKSPLYTEPEYQEILFIPNPKKGKMKLNTQDDAEDELNASLETLVSDDDDYYFNVEEYVDEDEHDEKPKKGTVKASISKKIKEPKVVKKAKTPKEKTQKDKKTPKSSTKVNKNVKKDNIKNKSVKKINKKTKK